MECQFIPKSCTNIRTSLTESTVLVQYDLHNQSKTVSLHIPPAGPVTSWTVIPDLNFLITVDLSFFATATGQDGHSHCRCVYCDLTRNDWNDSTCPKGNKLSLSMLKDYATQNSCQRTSTKIDTKGVIMTPQLDIEPQNYIVPLLHLMIGLVNKAWASLILFFDEFVEVISDKEAELKDHIRDCEKIIKEFENELEILVVNKNMAYAELSQTKSNRESLKSLITETNTSIRQYTDMKKKKTAELKQHKIELAKEKKARNGDKNRTENLLYNILDEHNIKKQHFHGGAMNGVCSRRLLDNIDPIFDKVRKMMSEKLKTKSGLTKEKISLLTQVLEDFISLFDILDLVFSRLRILDPTAEEIESAEKGIQMLEFMWKKLQLSITPKCHILFDHTMDQVKSHNGIADLVEDYVEHAHQTGKQLNHLVAHISSPFFREKELVKIRRQWLTNDPLIQQQLQKVRETTKRRIEDSPTVLKCTKSSKKMDLKKVKRETTEKKIRSSLSSNKE